MTPVASKDDPDMTVREILSLRRVIVSILESRKVTVAGGSDSRSTNSPPFHGYSALEDIADQILTKASDEGLL